MKQHKPVMVFDGNNKALHSTKNFAHIRHLLKNGKAEVVSRNPFTIKLMKKI